MRFGVSKRSRSALLLSAACVWIAGAAQASSITGDLTVEFDDGIVATYGTVAATEDGSGGIDFSIDLSGVLGAAADLHVFYFNLLGTFTGVAISDTNAPHREYRLWEDPRVRGGAGSSFDYGVSFGNGAGRRGNGILDFASFTITADQALSVDDLMEISATRAGIKAEFATHIQGTNTLAGSETVGGVWTNGAPTPGSDAVPEPGTFFLMSAGVLGLAVVGRRRR